MLRPAKMCCFMLISLLFINPIDNASIVRLNFSEYPPTVYGIIQMVDILLEMGDDHIWVSPSDPKIFLFFLQKTEMLDKHGILFNPNSKEILVQYWVNTSDSPYKMRGYYACKAITEKTKVPIIKVPCVLGYVVEQLVDEAMAANYVPKIESVQIKIQKFVEKWEQLCAHEKDEPCFSKERIINRYLGLGDKYSGMDKVNCAVKLLHSNAHNVGLDIVSIVSVLLAELDTMLTNGDWNYANLKYMKMLEWDLLEFDLTETGQKQKWEAIEKARNEWEKALDKTFKAFYDENAQKNANFKALMEKLKEQLEKVKKEKEEEEEKEKEKEKEGKEKERGKNKC